MRGAQLPLAVARSARWDFAHFVPGANGEAIDALRGAERQIYLFGPAGCGKSHLLTACAREHAGAVLLDERQTDALPVLLDGAERAPWLGLDDIAHLAGTRETAVALARALDARAASGRPTAVSARAPATALSLLPDLVTRLGRMTVFALAPLDDATLQNWLRDAAHRRGLTLAEPAIAFLMQRLPRNPAAMQAALHRLDTAALAAKRSQITLPFVRTVLEQR